MYVKKGDCCFGSVSSGWEFDQTRYPFLVEYVRGFIESPAPGGVRVDDVRARRRVRAGLGGRTVKVRFRECGVRTLLGSGIARYSWKVSRWLKLVEETRSERAKYYTTGQAASVLGVSKHVVRRWLEAGMMAFVRRRVRAMESRRPALSHYYVPIAEVEKLGEKRGRVSPP